MSYIVCISQDNGYYYYRYFGDLNQVKKFISDLNADSYYVFEQMELDF